MILLLLIAAIALLVLLEGFFSGCETVYTSTSKAFIHERAERGDPRAIQIRALLARTERFLGTTLTGTNLALVASTALCQITLSGYVVPSRAFQWLVATFPAPWNWESVLNTIIMTPVVLVFAELIPKTIGRAHADALALRLAAPLRLAGTILRPLVWVMGSSAGWLAGLVGGKAVPAAVPAVSRDDLRAIAEMAVEQGLLPGVAAAMLQDVLELDRKPVSAMMVPLVDVASLPVGATLAAVEELSLATGYARFPVYQERVDDIVGIVDLRHILYETGGDGAVLRGAESIEPYIHRNIVFIPEFKPVGELLHELRYQHIPMAVVVDEYGGVVGILTLEDLVEEVVGDIQDERDQPVAEVVAVGKGVYECLGKTQIEAVEEVLGLSIPRDGFETVAGLVLKLGGRIPHRGDRLRFGGYEIEVIGVEKRRITRLRFCRLPAEDEP